MSTGVTAGGPPVADDTATPAPRRTVSTASIRRVVAGYVSYRSSLPNRRISNDSTRTDDVVEDQTDGLISDVDLTTSLPSGLEHTVRILSSEFEQRYEQEFRESCGEIFITPNNAQTLFLASLQSLFSDGIINWGRVVALFAFSGSLAAQCVEKEMPFLVDQVTNWTTAYIANTNLASWIYDNGGWEGLVDFYGNSSDRRRNGSSWPSLSTLCGCAFGAISVLTLGALFAQR